MQLEPYNRYFESISAVAIIENKDINEAKNNLLLFIMAKSFILNFPFNCNKRYRCKSVGIEFSGKHFETGLLIS